MRGHRGLAAASSRPTIRAAESETLESYVVTVTEEESGGLLFLDGWKGATRESQPLALAPLGLQFAPCQTGRISQSGSLQS
jgi:hypothetical protein